MRQVWITKAGEPAVLQVRQAADPQPKEQQLRIRVEASGINFADILGRMGMYPDLPALPTVPGYEVAGVVDAVGPKVSSDWLGKKVFATTRFGGYSDVVCVHPFQAFERPTNMSAEQGAAMPVNYLTAWQLMVSMGGLKAGEKVLVHSAGGGVGIAAIQLAKHIGAEIIGTASGHKWEFLKSLGVDHLIDYRSEDFEKRVKEITEGRGVHLVLDAVGGDSYKKSYRCLAATGRLGMFGISSIAPSTKRSWFSVVKFAKNIPWYQFNPLRLMNENKAVFGVNIGHMWHEADLIRQWSVELMALFERGVIAPQVDSTFKLEEAAAAHQHIQDRKNIGKVLLVS